MWMGKDFVHLQDNIKKYHMLSFDRTEEFVLALWVHCGVLYSSVLCTEYIYEHFLIRGSQ